VCRWLERIRLFVQGTDSKAQNFALASGEMINILFNGSKVLFSCNKNVISNAIEAYVIELFRT
jgi:hypothetical protein